MSLLATVLLLFSLGELAPSLLAQGARRGRGGTPQEASSVAELQGVRVSSEEFLAAQDKAVLDRQAQELYHTFDEVTAPYADSVVYVGKGRQALAMGVIVAPEKVLTKWSDLTRVRGNEVIVQKDKGVGLAARVIGGNEEHDLVLLEVPGLEGKALDFAESTKAEEGDFLLSVLPGGVAGGFGVVSVAERSLRDTDLPYLGVISDISYGEGGARVEGVERGSGAQKAGIKPGDVILKLDSRPIDGPLSLRTGLKDKKPGDAVVAQIKRDNDVMQLEIALAARPAMKTQFSTQRLETMNAIGNPMSLRREGFPSVIQTDMTLNPAYAGSPVIGIDGKLRGIALSRAGRIESYVLPAQLIASSLKEYFKSSESEKSADKVARQTAQHSPSNQPRRDERLERMLRKRQQEILRAEVLEEESPSPKVDVLPEVSPRSAEILED